MIFDVPGNWGHGGRNRPGRAPTARRCPRPRPRRRPWSPVRCPLGGRRCRRRPHRRPSTGTACTGGRGGTVHRPDVRGAAPAGPPPMPALGELGGGGPSLGTGASGFGQQLADLIGGLLGSSGDGTSEQADDRRAAPTSRTPSPETPTTPTRTPKPPTQQTIPPRKIRIPQKIGTMPAEETEPDPEPEPPPAATLVPPPQPEPAPPIAPAVPEAAPAAKTPCEIAADELPQVGE